MGGGATVYYNDEELRTEDQCNGEAMTRYVSLGSYAYFFVMLCALTKYSYGTRRALSVFQESTCAYFSSFLAEPEHRDVTDANQKASSQSASTTHNSQAFSP